MEEWRCKNGRRRLRAAWRIGGKLVADDKWCKRSVEKTVIMTVEGFGDWSRG